MRRLKERGSAMLVTMIIIAALLAGAAVLASMQVSSNRSTELTRNGLAALYCAEAGLTTARALVSTNYGNWDAALTANCTDDGNCNTVLQPTWLGGSHDIDGDTIDDYMLSIRDNDDDLANNGADDSDEKVFIVSRCIKYPDSPRQIEELIHYKPAMNPYACQGGGINGGANDNDHTSVDCSGN
jgi:type II secretory pathway pseudopilin PulG